MTKPKRILHIVGSLGTGGIQSLLMNLYRTVDRDRIQFDFLVHIKTENSYANEIYNLGGKIFYIDGDAFERKRWYLYYKFLSRFFRQHKEYNIIHGHLRSTSAIYLSIAKREGCYTIAHSHSTSNGYGIGSILKNSLQYPTRYIADYYMGCSEIANTWMFGEKKAHSNNCCILRNGIDIKRYIFNDKVRKIKRKELGFSDKDFILGNVGRIVAQKGQEILISIMPQILFSRPESKLIIIGEGPMRDMLEHKISELNLSNSIFLLGNRQDVPELLSCMDVFVMPSRNEGLGISAIEAQANNLPTLVSKAIPNEVFITPSIHLVEHDEDWKDKILSVGNRSREDNPALIANAGYDIRMIVNDLMDFYENIDNRNH